MPHDLQETEKRLLILDTNVLIYWHQPSTIKLITHELDNLEKNYELSISEMSAYEMLRGQNVKDVNYALAFLNTFNSLSVTKETFVTCAYFYRIFRKLQLNKNIQDPDIVIAATAFLNDSLILTVNRNDFPYPYFEEVSVSPILYNKEPHKTDCLLLCLLKPNIKVIISGIEKFVK